MKHLIILAVLALLVAACGGGGDVAATVDGTEITVADVDEQVAHDGAIPEDTFRAELQNLIVSMVAIDAAREEFGIDPTEEEVEAQYQTFVQTISQGGGGDYEAGLEQQGITDARVRRVAREQLVVEALQEELAGTAEEVTDEQVAEELEASRDSYTNACVSHILVETEEEADAVRERLEGGEDFAEVAKDASIEPAAAESGGDLGCGPLAQWVPEFSDGVKNAEVGEPTEPVESEFGFHVILVESIDDEDAAAEAARSQLTAQGAQDAFIAWVDEAMAAAEVEVAERYGTWTTDPAPAIVPPEGTTEESAPQGTGGTAPADSQPAETQPTETQPTETQPGASDEEPAG